MSVLTGSRLLYAKRILVASDYDGTLTPLVARPEQAAPDADLVELLRRLCASPGVTVSILSGRRLDELADWLLLPELVLVGGHGAEWRPPGCPPSRLLAPLGIDGRVRRVEAALEDALGRIAGAHVERKKYSVAAHCRLVSETDLRAFEAGFAEVAAAFEPEFLPHEGKKVRELRPAGVDKGRALESLRRTLALDGVPALVLGDDVTDEEAFASLVAGDLSLKVGEGDSRADARLPDFEAARMLLADLARYREEISP